MLATTATESDPLRPEKGRTAVFTDFVSRPWAEILDHQCARRPRSRFRTSRAFFAAFLPYGLPLRVVCVSVFHYTAYRASYCRESRCLIVCGIHNAHLAAFRSFRLVRCELCLSVFLETAGGALDHGTTWEGHLAFEGGLG